MLNRILEESCSVKHSLRTCMPVYSNQDEASDLIRSQVEFGLAYTRESRSAYQSGNFEYAEVARKIAVNAYAAAVRFSAHLLKEPRPVLATQVEKLEAELEGLLEPIESGLRSIA